MKIKKIFKKEWLFFLSVILLSLSIINLVMFNFLFETEILIFNLLFFSIISVLKFIK